MTCVVKLCNSRSYNGRDLCYNSRSYNGRDLWSKVTPVILHGVVSPDLSEPFLMGEAPLYKPN